MNISRLFHTLKYLKPEQWFYRGWYPIKRKFYHPPGQLTIPISQAEAFGQKRFYKLQVPTCYDSSNNSFIFLNINHLFENKIDWDLEGYGRLWTYNLNYFNWLNDENLSLESRLETVKEYVNSSSQTGSEPYPTSLRGINWIKFLSANKIYDETILKRLYTDHHRLAAFPEYHIQANHLLENACSLFFAAHFFNDKDFYELAAKLLTTQLAEQILPDGGHYEQSPMYHCIILQRVLECYELAMNSNRFQNTHLQYIIKDTATKMTNWLRAICDENGRYAMVGDSAPGIAPSPKQLFAYANHLKLEKAPLTLRESGYRKLAGKNYEAVIDVGSITPFYQPGHAHADTFHFCLNAKGKPVIVDTGISTYEKNERRLYERGTEAHNTVCVEGINSSDVWDGFRTGRRAMVTIHEETVGRIAASHDGYEYLGIIHHRTFNHTDDTITITDRLDGQKGRKAIAYIHFHPSCKVEQLNAHTFRADNIIINISGGTGAGLVNYLYCIGFNKTEPATRLRIDIEETTVVSIHI